MAHSTAEKILRVVEPLIYARRWVTLIVLLLLTLFFGWQASQVRFDAGFAKQLPLDHEYIQTFLKYQDTFGGANLLLVALIQEEGDIYNEEFLTTLKDVTDAVFYINGVERGKVNSLFTPDTRYTEVIEGGFHSDLVIPVDYAPTPKMFEQIRRNVSNANIIGRAVSLRQNGAVVTAELLEIDPVSGERLNPLQVAEDLESKIRDKFQTDNINIHILGFARIVGDVANAVSQVALFFAIALLMTAALLWIYCGSFKLSLLPLSSALVAVIWEFGLLKMFGFGLDPFAILVPFLVLSVGVSHGVQFVNAWVAEVADHGRNAYDASLETFRRLAIPGTTALITDVIGFATIYLINIDVIQEMAINAALGIAAIIVSNKVLMPVMLTWVSIGDIETFKAKQQRREAAGDRLWRAMAAIVEPRWALTSIAVCGLLLGWALWKGQELQIGDFQTGVPEFWPDSRYNRDSAAVAANFAIGEDLLKVIVETEEEACIDYEVMEAIDRFVWEMENTPGVHSATSLATIAKRINQGWSDDFPKWRKLPRQPQILGRNIRPVPSDSGLYSTDCSKMPVLIFTEDHRAETINGIMAVIEDYKAANETDKFKLALASGNIGIMAATNEVIAAQEKPILMWVYLAIIICCWLSFRSAAGVFSIILPLSLVSLMAYAVMAQLEIGLKVATLPVTALAVGIGIDYGIYIYSVLEEHIEKGLHIREAYFQTLRKTGKAVIFTGISLGLSVCTWLWSDLKFQADMGALLIFMFVANMFGAILVLPAIARFLMKLPDAQK